MKHLFTFAHHCGAVLLGKKPAALFSCPDDPALLQDLALLAQENGLSLIQLQQRRQRAVLFIYDSSLLQTALAHPLVQKHLPPPGYQTEAALDETLQHLRARMQMQTGFPHEIGFFLGYPPADVVGFIWHGGKKCRHSCLWKVYTNVEAAKALCREYEHCSRLCCAHVAAGGNLATLRAAIPA